MLSVTMFDPLNDECCYWIYINNFDVGLINFVWNWLFSLYVAAIEVRLIVDKLDFYIMISLAWQFQTRGRKLPLYVSSVVYSPQERAGSVTGWNNCNHKLFKSFSVLISVSNTKILFTNISLPVTKRTITSILCSK